MNLVFHSIWNAAIGAWVAAPETASAGGRKARGSSACKAQRVLPVRSQGLPSFRLSLLAGAAVLLCTTPWMAWAQVFSENQVTPIQAPTGGQDYWDGGALIIGNTGSGQVDVEEGAELRSQGARLGIVNNINGRITITDANSKWIDGGTIALGESGSGTLRIVKGGEASIQGIHMAVKNAISPPWGLITVNGQGSKLTVTGDFIAGVQGKATINVLNSGLLSTGAATLGKEAGSEAVVTVQGAGSEWVLAGDLAVGQAGVGVLNIQNQGKVTGQANSAIALDAGSQGTVKVDGAGSSWEVGNLWVGEGGTGTLNVQNGAVVRSAASTVGLDAGAQGVVALDSGASWTVNGLLVVGASAKGDVTVNGGAQLVSSSAKSTVGGAGGSTPGTGTITVTGNGSQWQAAETHIGAGGAGTLVIAQGGEVSSEDTYLGSAAGATGTVSVDGAGSLWKTGRLTVGDAGNGEVTLQNGGQASSQSVQIGNTATSSDSKAVVQGDGTVWRIEEELSVGAAGVGALTIEQAAKVSAASVSIGQTNGTGTLNVLGSSDSDRGVLATSQITQGAGNATLNLDGGVLRATANESNYLNNFSTVALGANGVVIDTNTYDVGVQTALSSAAGGNGGLIKQGLGTLTLSGSNSYSGATDLLQGVLQAGMANAFSSASTHNVSVGTTLDLASHNQTVAALNNSGTVSFSSLGMGTPSTVLKVTGPYVGSNGVLLVSTVLAEDGSASDQLLMSGASAIASGTTSIHVANAGGLGAVTTDVGIPVVLTEGGASLNPGSFSLKGEHVDAGAYEYRLYQTAQGAVLRSNAPVVNPGPDPEPNPGPDPDPVVPVIPSPSQETAYRSEVPLLSPLPSQLRQADMGMLGDLHKRMGDTTPSAQGATDRRVWGRVLRIDPTIRQQGTVNPESQGHMSGFQAGVDLYAAHNIHAGLYVGQLEGDMNTSGFASGIQNNRVGFNSLRSRYLGVYGTWENESGLYADTVFQRGDYRSNLHADGGSSQTRIKSHGWLLSLEVGQAFAINSQWQIEPQAQIIYRRLNMGDATLGHATVKTDADDDLTLRLGARIKGSFTTAAGVLQPYGRINVYKASKTTDVTTFYTAAETTAIQTQGGYTSTELAAGATLLLSPRTSLYGELGKLWSNSGASRVKSGAQASLGIKVTW